MLETSIDAHPGDDAVAFNLRVENRGDEDAELAFSDSQRVRVSAVPADADDAEPRWRSDDEQMFMQVLGSETVPAGGSIAYREEWENPESGAYRAVGEVVCSERDLQAETTFCV